MKTQSKIKSLALFAFMMLFGFTVNAQTTLPEAAENYDQGFRLGFGLNGGFVFEDPYEMALGADIRLQYDLSQRTSLTFTTGFTNLFIEGDDNDLGFVPAKLGFKGFIWEDQFYLLGEAGAGIPVTHTDIHEDTTLILAPGIGWVPSKYIDISLRYEYYGGWKNIDGDKGVGQLALRLAYGFKL